MVSLPRARTHAADADGFRTPLRDGTWITAEGAHWRLRSRQPIAVRRTEESGMWGESATAVGATSVPNPAADPVGGRRKGTV